MWGFISPSTTVLLFCPSWTPPAIPSWTPQVSPSWTLCCLEGTSFQNVLVAFDSKRIVADLFSDWKGGWVDFRSLGVTDSTGLQPRVSYSSNPIISSKAGAFARKARDTYEGGDKSLLEKGAIERVRVPHHPQYISQMFFVPKKGRINEASVQSERTESVPTLVTFQNGKGSDDQRSHPRRRLNGQNGSEGFFKVVFLRWFFSRQPFQGRKWEHLSRPPPFLSEKRSTTILLESKATKFPPSNTMSKKDWPVVSKKEWLGVSKKDKI